MTARSERLWMNVARAVPHALALVGSLVAWLSFRGGIEWASHWGWLGACALLVHMVLRSIPRGAYRAPHLSWSASRTDVPSQENTDRKQVLVALWLELPAALRTAALVGLTVALFRWLGPKRTRLISQIVSAVVGAAFVIGVQVAARQPQS